MLGQLFNYDWMSIPLVYTQVSAFYGTIQMLIKFNHIIECQIHLFSIFNNLIVKNVALNDFGHIRQQRIKIMVYGPAGPFFFR